jgi:hypothetical protein
VEDADLGDTFTLQILTPPTNGTAQVIGNRWAYTPGAAFTGPDSFTYLATDAAGASVSGKALVRVYGSAALANPWSASGSDLSCQCQVALASTTEVSIWRSEMDQYLRSRRSISGRGRTRYPFFS